MTNSQPPRQLYTRLAIAPVHVILDHVHEHLKSTDKVRVDIEGYSVGVYSLRMRTFERDRHKLFCVSCGLRGAFFSIERQTNNKLIVNPHANLYGVKEDGEEVLFTHDHILARALGGKDVLANTQTMCYPCNQEKGHAEKALIEAQRRAV